MERGLSVLAACTVSRGDLTPNHVYFMFEIAFTDLGPAVMIILAVRSWRPRPGRP